MKFHVVSHAKENVFKKVAKIFPPIDMVYYFLEIVIQILFLQQNI